ncbi:hypothetical protein [Desulfosudis oleivorans]|uniref:Nucleotidyl transferase AbiEii/AbiGii toxin family protein n=1 Tax=Desulfosudis oleivorans (strain DSM 6200 / JCM 39069 / Hxd3) TaxID=96561 RepID=A8ZS25_DESOH|nr:hypothetical protein [Desulfosudis oleivorans]ABW66043.1 conserved hypothetical protein [Desulfosudis oleivorans Hxd3]
MIIGLDKFAAHFSGYRDRYLLIGGAAVWLILEEAGIEPRATRDLDIVLCLEALDPDFGAVFWDFIKAGGYKIQEKSTGKKNFYRFVKPSQPDYPVMLELFARRPDALTLHDDSHLTPIPTSEEASSLSAILLDDNYYDFLHRHKRAIGGISFVSEYGLIPLKARAWLDLTQRKAAGENIDSRDIKKHRNDVLRLYQILSPEIKIDAPEAMRRDLDTFLRQTQPALSQEILKSLGVRDVNVVDVIQTIRIVYGI